MSDLYRLVYASKNLLQGSEPEVMAAVRQILDASQRNNAALGVTGALMFNAGAFAQVLEGPRRGVETTFERIQRDLRHDDVTVLQCGPAESRAFANWSMAFVGQSSSGQARFSSLSAESGFDLARLDGDRVFAMLHGLVLEEEGFPVVGADPVATAFLEAAPVEAAPLESAPVERAPLAAGPEPRAAAGLDVAQVRAEIARLRPEPASQAPGPAPAGSDRAPRAAPVLRRPAGTRGATEAALSVLKAALASERQRTTDLRAEIDGLRVALAASADRLEVLRDERDLWAGRAGLLARTLAQAAEGVRAAAPAVADETPPAAVRDTRTA
ncbi:MULTISPECIES: BLUF domain-containing protein [Methylobacterium]|uniref:BLUF domain-containing protein n=1 Tax=Methylobacterium oryzae CBMB20 TaxID=693986 RepID=A0A089P248_9HYPH|nr:MULTISPECIES: BLUF domain-containing protein [Methylobacterium]AIQ92835.1 BLUF domain-containing protein [Methylobacterium oryzae CBMB20]AWV15683.1 blue light sensor protein [Methylobacterium sp. XJLW]WFS06708.1 BLUF domain-containing protein [Methylobacterium sp. 391_Methyba4]